MKRGKVSKLLSCVMAGVFVAAVLSGCGLNVDPDTSDISLDLDDEAPETEEIAEEADFEEAPEEENEIFGITLPKELEGKYIIKSAKNGYSVYDKEAHEADWGGFAFGVQAYKEPKEYSGGMSTKVGEIRNGDEVLYDIVKDSPSDVQYDVSKYQDGMPETYDALYHGADDIIKTIRPKKDGEFIWGAGCKGDGLYGEVFEKFLRAIDEEWDADRFEKEDMSPEYNTLIQADGKKAADEIGYAYTDLNFDGIEELLIADISGDDKDPAVFDIYTMVNRKPEHVVSGWSRNRYYPLENGMMVCECSNGADDSEWIMYDIEPNGTELSPQIGLKMDGYEDKDKPWFVIYGADEEGWESISEEDFDWHMKSMEEHKKLEYKPLSKAGNASESEEEQAEENYEKPDYKDYKSDDGWSVTYDANYINCQESSDPEEGVGFNFTGESAGTNMVIIRYDKKILPDEAIKDIKKVQNEDTKVNVSEGIFPGTDDKWGYWVDFEYPEKGSGYEESYIIGEYNGGTLLIQFIGHKSGDDETDMLVSDELSMIVDSLKYKDFKPQTMYEDMPGTYKEQEKGKEHENHKLVFNEDHTGTLSFQDDINILWGEKCIIAADGSFKYMLEKKGDEIALDYDGENIKFVKAE